MTHLIRQMDHVTFLTPNLERICEFYVCPRATSAGKLPLDPISRTQVHSSIAIVLCV